ncbi:MAG TPA: phage protease [Planctomycetota bacterium]|nr:phage protease [Planctomycetota bacterium]
MKSITIQNKSIDLADGGLEVWCQVAPFGEFTGRTGDGRVVTQVCDRAAFEQVAAAFEPEVLVDFEHRAENTDDTTAAAWVQALEIREDGLWGLLRFTDTGAEAVRGRRLRFLSPVWALDENGRPAALKSIALTNTPNFNLRPVLNKAAPGGDGNKPQTKGHNMKELAALYGLPETATEAEILEAAKAAKERADALEARLAELESAALNTEAEKVAEEHGDKIENKAEFIKLYVANKDVALAVLKTVKAPAPVTNKALARKPQDVFGGTVQNKLTEYEKMPEGPGKAKFLRDNAQEINDLRNARADAV